MHDSICVRGVEENNTGESEDREASCKCSLDVSLQRRSRLHLQVWVLLCLLVELIGAEQREGAGDPLNYVLHWQREPQPSIQGKHCPRIQAPHNRSKPADQQGNRWYLT